MPRAPRPDLTEATPSVAYEARSGGRDTERTLLSGDGIAVMFNEDNSVLIEVYDDAKGKRIGLRISPGDAVAHAPDFRRWSLLRKA